MNRPGGDTRQRRRRARALLLRTLCLLGIVTAGCGGDGPVPANPDASSDAAAEGVLLPPEGRDLVPVAMPDFELMTEPVAEQMRTYRTAVRVRLGTVAAEPAALGDAYGQLGMLLLAATYVDAAEASLLNAQTLQPDDGRWPYYLGRVHEANGDLEASAASYRRAVDLRPDDLATRMLLANVLFARGELEAAERIYSRPSSGTRMRRRRRRGSVGSPWPDGNTRARRRASSRRWPPPRGRPRSTIRSRWPIGGLATWSGAEAHLQRQGDVEALSPDPLRQELDELLESANAYNIRGGRALDAGNYRAAADLFRRGLELDPDDPSLRQRLGVALFQLDDVAGAVDAFEQVVRTTPEHTEAQFSLGVVRADQGRHREAIDHLSTALRHDSAYIQARMQLANVLARSGRADEALSHYERALAQDPTRLEAMFGAAMTLVRLERYAAARDRLQQGVEADPGNRMFRHALARLLASAPDGGVRDGRGAMTIVEELLADGQDLAPGRDRPRWPSRRWASTTRRRRCSAT